MIIARTLSGPTASVARARHKAESMPPDTPRTTRENPALMSDSTAAMQEGMTQLRDELAAVRAAIEPLGATAERFVRFRDRLPGGNSRAGSE